ncbi:uncharacterized protein METZ01_LOCUS420401, partial [marine metagenome]
AVGDARQHQSEQTEIVDQALDIDNRELRLEDVQRSRQAEGQGGGTGS